MAVTNKNSEAQQKYKDSQWKELNEKVQNLIVANDLFGLKNVYVEMAEFVKSEGKDNAYLLELAYKSGLKLQKEELKRYKKFGTCKGVEIITVTNSPGNNSCEACAQFNGKVFTISEALLKNPLPVKNCCHKWGCRCVYAPVVD